MSRTLSLSDDLYARLEATARQRGFAGVEQLLEAWQMTEEERRRCQQVVQHIDSLRQELFNAHGQMPDCVELIRADRER